MTATDNPAGRLVALLEQARGHGDTKLTREVWAGVFGLENSDRADLLYMYAQLIQLVKSAKDSISQLDNIDQEIYQQPFKKLERTFSKASLESRWQSTKAELDDATMVALRFCADTLSRERGEGAVDTETLTDLAASVSTLLDQILVADMPENLKLIVAENLEAVRRAIFEYRMRGAEGLRRALETAIGSLIRHRDDIKQHQDKKPIKEYLDLLGHLNQLAALGLKTKELLAPVVQYFLGPGETSG